MKLAELNELAIAEHLVCRSCRSENWFLGNWGPHPGGLSLEGFKEPQWVFLSCQECGYDTSFGKWKLSKAALAQIEAIRYANRKKDS